MNIKTTFLIGTQPTTGNTHLTTTNGQQRCGMGRSTRYGLSINEDRVTIDKITCKRCRQIALKQLDK